MREEGSKNEEIDLHVLWHEELQRLLQNCRAVMSPGGGERIRFNRRSGLKRKLLSLTRKNYNFVRDTYEGYQSPFRAMHSRANMICEGEIGNDQREWRCVLLKLSTNPSICVFLTSWSNRFRLSRLIQSRSVRQDSITTTIIRQTTRRTTITSEFGRRSRPRRRVRRPGTNMSLAEMSMMRRPPGSSRNQTSWMRWLGKSRKKWRPKYLKWSRRMGNPYWPFKLYLTKLP